MEQLELEDCTWEGHMFYLELKQQCLCFIILREQIVVDCLLRAQAPVPLLHYPKGADCAFPRKLQTTSHKFPKHLKSCIRNEKWLRIRLGDFKSPGDCILYGPEWESISPIAILPFIDDSENCYANAIHTNKEVLKKLKVVVDLKNENGNSLDASFKNKLLKKWLKTCVGFKSPRECLLFNSEWASLLKTSDGPFIDDEFYRSKIISYRKELNTIGVGADVKKVCSLLATHIYSHSDFSTICRIYNFLRESNWKPECDDVRRIWVPQGSNNGEWFKPEECVIHDKMVSLVLDDYCTLWKIWEKSEREITHAECCAFWSCVGKHCGSHTGEKITETRQPQPSPPYLPRSKLSEIYQKMGKIDTTMHKSTIECAIYFSEAIAKGLLREKKDRVSVLSELLKLGFFVKFDKEAVGFLMKSKNLQVLKDGEDFMSASFPFE
ncbi:hypothetical protein ACFE04_026029 [Oxalis oulophora]